jgi:class 3 adenylate cyclase
MIVICARFIELRRTQIELAERNELLAQPSSRLGKFLSPQSYNSIFAGEHIPRVAAKRKKLTIFFSDIANFTETADGLESEELTNLLNQYLTEMSKVAVNHGATIDKYVGDAIMGFFGDPASRGT